MALQSYYRQIMDISMMEDNAKKAEASKAVFESLNKAKMPDQFNWAEEIFEGIHVRSGPDRRPCFGSTSIPMKSAASLIRSLPARATSF